MRTSGSSTLRLARTLTEAGFTAWAPRLTQRFRRPRLRDWCEREIAIVPSFVFARADQALALIAEAGRPITPHPPFHVFIHAGRVGRVATRQLAGIQAVEEEAAARHAAILAHEARLAEMKAADAERERRRLRVTAGDAVQIGGDAFTGLKGRIVTAGKRRAMVEFDNGARWEIDTSQLLPDAISSALPLEGIAAIAA